MGDIEVRCFRYTGIPSSAAPPAIKKGPHTTYQLSPLLREYQTKASDITRATRATPTSSAKCGVCPLRRSRKRHFSWASAEAAYGMADVIPVISTSVVN